MNSSKFRLTLDLHSVQSQYSIPVMVGDTNVTLLISITDGGIPYKIPDEFLAKLSIKRPTGTYLEEFCKVKNNAVIEYPFSQNENTCAVEGIHHCDVTLYTPDGKKVGGPRFTMVVSETVVRSDEIVLKDEDWRTVDSMNTEEASRQYAELLREKAEEDRVQAEADRRDAETKRGNITEYAIKAEESASRAEKAALSVEGHGEKIILNDKRITNLEKGYSDDLFTTDDTNATTKVVPYNALPYAEVKTLAGGYSYTGGIIYPRKPLRIESCKRAEKRKLDLTLDLTEMARYMSVEKLSDGSIKFNGYTNFQGDGAGSCKFATATVPKGSNYGVTCKVVSGSYNEDATKIKANGTTIHENDVYWHDGLVNVGSDNTLTLYIESEGALSYGDLTDLVLSFEIQEGFFNDYVFEPAFVPFATLEIPEEIRNIDGYGLYDNYLDFESKQLVLVRGLNETSSGMPPLPAPVYIDVSEYLGDDNLIEVVPNGTIKVIQDTGYEMSCKSEIVYMLKGV